MVRVVSSCSGVILQREQEPSIRKKNEYRESPVYLMQPKRCCPKKGCWIMGHIHAKDHQAKAHAPAQGQFSPVLYQRRLIWRSLLRV